MNTDLGLMPQPTNNLFPHQPDYQRPDRADDMRPTRVTAAAKRFDGGPGEVAYGAIQHAASAFQGYLNTLDTDRYSASGLAQQIGNFSDTDAYRAVAPAVQAVSDAADAAAQRVADVRGSLAQPGDAATESRATRYWEGKVRLLDSLGGSDVTIEAQLLVQTATPEQLRVLLEQLPDYLRSRNSASTRWIEDALATSVPDLANALADQTLANKARDVTIYNAEQLRDRVANTASPVGYRPPTLVPPTCAS